MKKWLACFLVLCLCVVLVACNSEGTPSESKTTKTTKKTDHVILEESEPQTPGQSSDNQQDELAPYLATLCGEWQILYTEQIGVFEKIALREDGTLLCDAKAYRWVFSFINEYRLYLTVFDGENKVGYFEMDFVENNDFSGSFKLDGMSSSVLLYKPALYEFIEVTPENWQEYFYIEEEMFFRDNAFGEAESCYLRTVMRLKEEYQKRFSKNLMVDTVRANIFGKGALEFSCDIGTQEATIDLANRTYALGEFTAKRSYQNTTTFEYMSGDDFLFAMLETDNIGSWEIEGGMLETKFGNFEVLRLQLTLCLLAE